MEFSIPRMKKHIPTLLATLIGSAISQQAFADDLMSQCMLGVPSYNRPLVSGDTNQLPVTIHSDAAKGNYPNDAVFTGSRRARPRRFVPSMPSVMCTTTTIRSS
jgi:LPS-assembly protein